MATYKSEKRAMQDTGDKPTSLGVSGRLHYMKDTATATVTAGAAADQDFDFARLLPGRVIILPELSRIEASDMEANADLHLGHRAYRNAAGDTVAEDDNEWLDNVDIGGGAIDDFWANITGYISSFDSAEYDAQDGLQLFVKINTGDITIGDTITLEVVYVHID